MKSPPTQFAGKDAPASPARCSATETAIDALLHRIEDVETSYEHELVTVRDDLQKTLSSLLQARRRSAKRIAALEDRAFSAADGEMKKRLAKMEKMLARSSDVKYNSLDRKVGTAAQRAAQAKLGERYSVWRLPFAVVLGCGLYLASGIRAWYRKVYRTHML